MLLDICNTECKLKKGLNALEFLDNNIYSISNWLTEVEQKLDEIDGMQLSNNLEAQIQNIEVRFNHVYLKINIFFQIYFIHLI